jgi:hypothetical protein
MINAKDITKAIEDLITQNEPGFTVERNARRNTDPNAASRGRGWVGIYKGPVDYTPQTTGARPWNATVEIEIELQCADMRSGADVEDALEEGVQELLNLFNTNHNLSGTVAQTVGYRVRYEVNTDAKVYWYAAVITIIAEVRQ